MTQTNAIQIALSATIILLYILFRIFHESHPIIKSFKSTILSTGTIMALHVLGDKIGVFMPLNFFSIAAAGILGIPGVCVMIVLNAIF